MRTKITMVKGARIIRVPVLNWSHLAFALNAPGGIDSMGSTERKYSSGRKHTTHMNENTLTSLRSLF